MKIYSSIEWKFNGFFAIYFYGCLYLGFYYLCSIPLTGMQKEVLVWTLLGDASLERAKPTHNTPPRTERSVRFDQSYPEHESYLQSIYTIFQNLTGPKGTPKIHSRKADTAYARTGKVYSSIAFKTRALDSLNYYHDIFYMFNTNGKRHKVVPKNIQELLTAQSLAYWIMDDGGINAYKATQLSTDSFTLEDIHILQEALHNNFQLRTRLIEKRSNQWMIVIPIRQTVSLSSIVGGYMHPSMRYKVRGL